MTITKNAIIFPILALTIADSLNYISWSGSASGTLLNSVIAVFRYSALFVLISIYNKIDRKYDLPANIFLIMNTLLVWQVATLAKGIITAKDYWDWRFLLFDSSLFLFIPLTFYIGRTILWFKTICAFTVKYLFKYGFIIIPLALVTNRELYSRLMISISIIIILIPYFDRKWRMLILIVAVASIAVEPGFRTNIIKTAASLGILCTYYFRKRISVRLMRIAFLTLFLLPVFFTLLAYVSGYNIFAEVLSEDNTIEYTSEGEVQNLAADTRTFLYQEVFTSLIDNQTLVTGEGASGKYKSAWFNEHGTGRFASEVGFLNIILYSGIIGIAIYAIFLITVAYYALYRSNNWLSKMLGVMIGIRWLLCFIEEFTQFDLNFFFFWLVLGLLSSNKFRSLNDSEVKEIFKFSL